jgi:serine/threonine protein kinase
MSDSGFLNEDLEFESIERLETKGSTSEAFTVKIKGKIYFMKRLRAEFTGDPKYRTLFRKEYEIGSSLSTPYIPEYIRLGDEEGNAYILMEYILGDNIEEKLTSDPQYFHNSKNIERLLIQLLEGLALLHKRDIIHLDIKPENIMLTRFGDNVKITDLGFCANAAYHRTAGYTAGFQAPEVEEKRWDAIDAQSDIYSVGMLLRYIKECSDAKFTRKLHSFMQHCLYKEKKRRFANCDEAIHFLKRGRINKIAAIATVCAIVATTAGVMLSADNEASCTDGQTSVTLYGVEYRILSHKDLTCEVIGGTGIDRNIYIDPEITIGNNTYRTVAIMDSAFNRSGILSVDIPEGIEVIGHGAFHDCDSIVTMNLPSTVRDFNGAFIRMSNVKKISLPGVKAISIAAFVDNSSVESIIIPHGVERICRDAFVSCTALKEVSLPQTLTVLERGVFYNCTSLEEITIPATVKEIGDYAFFECSNLHSIYLHATTPPRITAITDTAGVTVYVPAEALDAYKKDFNWRDYDIQPMEAESF